MSLKKRPRGDSGARHVLDESPPPWKQEQPQAPSLQLSEPDAAAARTNKNVVFLDPACLKYHGYLPESSTKIEAKTTTVDRVDVTTVTSHDFFQKYVATRRPCVLFHPASSSSSFSSNKPPKDLSQRWWNTLDRKAGHVTVQVEQRLSSNDSFGQNRTHALQCQQTVHDMIHTIPREQLHHYYVSTQQQQSPSKKISNKTKTSASTTNESVEAGIIPTADLEDSPYPDSEFFQALESSVDNETSLFGPSHLLPHLLLESRHVWWGFANSHSGLHHDYHDNVNVVLVGQKQWILYPPTEYPNIPLYGTVQGIHGINGLISYRDAPTRADGVPLDMLLSVDKDDDEADDEGGLDKNVNDEQDGMEDHDEDDESEESSVMLGLGADYQSEDDTNYSDEVDDGDNKRHPTSKPNPTDDCSTDGLEEEEEEEKSIRGTSLGTHPKSTASKNASSDVPRRPNSFSPVDTRLSREELARRFPDFTPRYRMEVTVQAGEALYLPASWFHCVTSIPSEIMNNVLCSTGNSESQPPPPYHLAVNYWYHPPDQLDYDRPYKDNFWQKRTRKSTSSNNRCNKNDAVQTAT